MDTSFRCYIGDLDMSKPRYAYAPKKRLVDDVVKWTFPKSLHNKYVDASDPRFEEAELWNRIKAEEEADTLYWQKRRRQQKAAAAYTRFQLQYRNTKEGQQRHYALMRTHRLAEAKRRLEQTRLRSSAYAKMAGVRKQAALLKKNAKRNAFLGRVRKHFSFPPPLKKRVVMRYPSPQRATSADSYNPNKCRACYGDLRPGANINPCYC